MELFGLKDKDGKEYKLLMKQTSQLKNVDYDGEKTVHHFNIDWEFNGIIPIESEPEFKVGEWVIASDRYELEGDFFPIFRIEEISNQGRIWLRPQKGKATGTLAECCHHAVPEEIEKHLRKICDEKYIGKKVISINSNEKRDVKIFKEYDFGSDMMFYYDQDQGYLASVYKQGQFAEIIPEKKRLPKTKEEVAEFLNDWANRPQYTTLDDFLKDYED